MLVQRFPQSGYSLQKGNIKICSAASGSLNGYHKNTATWVDINISIPSINSLCQFDPGLFKNRPCFPGDERSGREPTILLINWLHVKKILSSFGLHFLQHTTGLTFDAAFRTLNLYDWRAGIIRPQGKSGQSITVNWSKNMPLLMKAMSIVIGRSECG